MFDSIIDRAYEYLEANVDLELVEITKSTIVGTPRKDGAFMFVDKDAKSFGTVGGGRVEYEATLYARELLLKKSDGKKTFNLSADGAENIGMVCGGENDMRFTYLTNDEKSKHILCELKEANRSKNTVYIFGAGHVSMELVKILHYVGFETVIWDDRADYVNIERFKDSKKLICKDFDNILDELDIKETDFVVVMTRGHIYDYIVEKQVLKSKAAYIGVIGSSNKNKVLREKLLADGFSTMRIDNVCAPIGLSIAADTPEEIAISIASEMILFRARLEKRNKASDDNELIKMYKEKGVI